jgi:HAMP domain-containing protein
MIGYISFPDVFGQPLLRVRAELPRDLHRQGIGAMRYLLGPLLVVGLVFIGLVLVILEKRVLARTQALSRDVALIGQGGDPAARVAVNGHDELSELAASVNRMLAGLEDSVNRQEALEVIPDIY